MFRRAKANARVRQDVEAQAAHLPTPPPVESLEGLSALLDNYEPLHKLTSFKRDPSGSPTGFLAFTDRRIVLFLYAKPGKEVGVSYSEVHAIRSEPGESGYAQLVIDFGEGREFRQSWPPDTAKELEGELQELLAGWKMRNA